MSPRTGIALGSCSAAPDVDAFCQTQGHQQTIVNAVVAYQGAGATRALWKLLIGRVPLAGWTWPKYPNGTAATTPTIDCGAPGDVGAASVGGCLYNLREDPNERSNVASDPANAGIAAALFSMLQEANATSFSPNRGPVDPNACAVAHDEYGSFWGPWVP